MPFSIATLQEIWFGKQGLFVTDYLSDKTKTWESGEIRAFTSKCIAGSKNLNYKDQLALQNSIGQNLEIDESMFFAMAFHCLASGEKLMQHDFMRLNVRGADNDPLYVASPASDFILRDSFSYAYSFGGIGASLVIL